MADTRQEILDHAADLFVEFGYERTSLRQIAERVGVTKAALYYHFASKEALLDALISPAFEFIRQVLPAFEATNDLDEWGRLVGEFIDWMVGQQRLFAIVSRNSEVIEAIHRDSPDFIEHEDLHEGFRRLVAKPGIPFEHRVRLIGAMGLAASMFEFGGGMITESPAELRAVLRGLVDVVLHTPLPKAATALPEVATGLPEAATGLPEAASDLPEAAAVS